MLKSRETGIRWQGITVDFPLRRLRALQDISLEVSSGKVLAVMGPSGCGKSTLLKTAAGLVIPTEGTVQLGESPLSGPSRKVAMVFQEAALFPWFTVERNVTLALPRTMPRAEQMSQVSRLLNAVGLTDFGHVFPRELSGGMARRAALAAALARNPAALLLDEPFSGLDVTSRRRLARELVGIITERNLTTVLVTHSVDEVLMLADRVVILTARPGRVRAEFPVGLPHSRQGNEPELETLRTNLYQTLETEE